ncbi:MAG: type II toxin-antitoxin system RelE/ParE family toxin [Schleiferilactobacillus perolens]|jgi:phage-related protein|uniref:type II toxin-antitoxin system RelE/ParE family toxin n=1 Tax=Schleiferilactobacillus perolens TaxID=100468 RepID=UPI0039EA019C
MEKPRFRYFKWANGHSEFLEFLSSLPTKDQAKLLSAIQITQDKGIAIASRLKITKKLTDNLYELRSKQSSNIQRALYFHIVGNDYVITHGFTKKTDRTPPAEIAHAIELRAEFFARYKEDENNG